MHGLKPAILHKVNQALGSVFTNGFNAFALSLDQLLQILLDLKYFRDVPTDK